MSQIKIYIDEDTMDSDLVAALRSRGVTVITVSDAGLAEKSDDEQLAFAAEQGVFSTRSTSRISIGFTRCGPVPGDNIQE